MSEIGEPGSDARVRVVSGLAHCPECGGANGTHGLVHHRYPEGGGGVNRWCSHEEAATNRAYGTAADGSGGVA